MRRGGVPRRGRALPGRGPRVRSPGAPERTVRLGARLPRHPRRRRRRRVPRRLRRARGRAENARAGAETPPVRTQREGKRVQFRAPGPRHRASLRGDHRAVVPARRRPRRRRHVARDLHALGRQGGHSLAAPLGAGRVFGVFARESLGRRVLEGESRERDGRETRRRRKRRQKKSRAQAFGASPPSAARTLVSSELLSKHASAAPSTPEREARPSSPASTERSRSRSPGASSTHSTNTEASEAAYQAAVTTRLQHLPAGRFVYGRKHLQPFEFSAFWGSAESTRAGARATSAPEAEGKNANAARALEAKGGEESFRKGRSDAKEETGARFAVGRPRFSDTGSRGDAASSWRKKTPPAAPALAGGAAPERDPAALRWDGWGRGDGTVPAWGTSPSGARPGTSPGTGTAAPTPASFRAVLERSHSMEDSGSPTRGGLTRAFASSGLT